MDREHRYEQSFAKAAVQLEFVTLEQLNSVVGPAPASEKADVSQLLCEQGLITEVEAAAIAAVVARQVARTGGRDQAAETDGPLATEAESATLGLSATDAGVAGQSHYEWRRFTLLRPHAQGGLGRVQVARDRQINREVALKEILPSHADDSASRDRFVREAEITGALEHPGVVPVYSLGQYPDGRPFYAMRFIAGENLRSAIADFHERPGAAIGADVRSRQLLGRFIDACQAIHYAHNRGIVHRDVKPDNIMLGDYGETLVVDWGLARHYQSAAEAPSAHRQVSPSTGSCQSHTLDGQIVGTPAYMSPEQAAGRLDLLGPTVDVYSLGATLYHLLTGQPPFTGKTLEVLPLVERGRFPAPRQHNRRVPRPLEAICLRAMALRPEDRYPTALALALDLERYLADERVEAYAEPLRMRAWRWIRNHRTPVLSMMAATTVALVALSVGVALLGAANKRERLAKEEATANFGEAVKQRLRAEENFQHAQEAVREYYVKVSEETLLSQPGMQPLRNELLRQALGYYERFLRQRSDDPALRAESAQAAYFAGQITEVVSSPEAAIPYYKQSLAHYKLLQDPGAPSAEVARVLNAIGGAYQKLNRLELARESYVQARQMREELAERRPDDHESARELSNTLMNLGSLALVENEAAEGLRLMQQAQAIRLAHSSDDPIPLKLQRDIAMGHFNLAAAQLTSGQTTGARRNLLDAEAAFAMLLEREPSEFQHQRRLSLTRRLLGDLAAANGDLGEARDYYRQIRTALTELLADNPNVPDLSVDLAGVLMNLAALESQSGDAQSALDDLQTAEGLLERLNQENSIPRYRRDLGATRRAMGELLAEGGQADDARRALDSSRELLQQLVREFPTNQDYAAQLRATITSLNAVREDQ